MPPTDRLLSTGAGFPPTSIWFFQDRTIIQEQQMAQAIPEQAASTSIAPLSTVPMETGAIATYTRTVSDADIVAFATLSGDINPVHLDDEYAATTPFNRRIAHGMLTGAYISTVLGTILPGPGAIYLEQNLKFRAPVYIGDTITATVTVESYDLVKGIAMLKTDCANQDGLVVIEGTAKILFRAATEKGNKP